MATIFYSLYPWTSCLIRHLYKNSFHRNPDSFETSFQLTGFVWSIFYSCKKNSDFKSIRGLTGWEVPSNSTRISGRRFYDRKYVYCSQAKWEEVKRKRAGSHVLFLNSLLLLLFVCFLLSFFEYPLIGASVYERVASFGSIFMDRYPTTNKMFKQM